jgi:hypothetical protein
VTNAAVTRPVVRFCNPAPVAESVLVAWTAEKVVEAAVEVDFTIAGGSDVARAVAPEDNS